MKRLGYQIERVADMENLRWAFWKAQRGKAGKAEVVSFRSGLSRNLRALREALLDGAIQVGDYHYFKIFDPKERQICAAAFRERVLHHALMNVCHPHFEQKQIDHSYATRIGKGTHKALEQAHRYCRKYGWYLKMDFRKYFDSLDHQVLQRQLFRMYKDERLLKCLYAIIDSYEVLPGKGAPIGNLTSQYFANHYLSEADHLCIEELGAPAYVRYMDDVVVWHYDKNRLLDISRAFKDFTDRKLRLTLKPAALNRSCHGLPFLGYLIYPEKIHLNKRSKRRYIQKVRYYYQKLDSGAWSQQDFQRHVLPLTAFAAHADSRGFRNQVIRRIAGQQSKEALTA